jgi:hypothetical protein
MRARLTSPGGSSRAINAPDTRADLAVTTTLRTVLGDALAAQVAKAGGIRSIQQNVLNIRIWLNAQIRRILEIRLWPVSTVPQDSAQRPSSDGLPARLTNGLFSSDRNGSV